MNHEQIAQVRESFVYIRSIAEYASHLFYQRLFERDPSLRPLFPADMREQEHKLMDTLDVVVKGLDQLDTLMPMMRALGQRHVGYGARPEHYAMVEAALLWTIRQGLGLHWTPAIDSAWAAAYTVIAQAMQAAGAAEARA